MTTARDKLPEANKTAPAVCIRLDRTVRLTVTELHQLLDYAQHCENEGWYWGNKAQFRKRHDKLKAWLNAQIDLRTSRLPTFATARRPQDDVWLTKHFERVNGYDIRPDVDDRSELAKTPNVAISGGTPSAA